METQELDYLYSVALENLIKKNNIAAYNFMYKAAIEGHVNSQLQLGYMYENSIGVTLDFVQAATWYYTALVNGCDIAKFHLGRYYIDKYLRGYAIQAYNNLSEDKKRIVDKKSNEISRFIDNSITCRNQNEQEATTESGTIISIKNSEGELERYSREFMIFIDTSSLMEEGSKKFFIKLSDVMKHNKRKLYILNSVVNELKRNITKSNKEEKALRGLDIVDYYNSLNIIQEDDLVTGFLKKAFADKDFLSIMTHFRVEANQLLITQDSDLGKDVETLINYKSIKTQYKVEARKIVGGKLICFE